MSKAIKAMYKSAIAKGAKGIEVPKGSKGIHSSAFHKCVTEVAKGGKVDNPYAVCMAKLGRNKAVKAGHRSGAISKQSQKARAK